jgi:hypothetical protein
MRGTVGRSRWHGGLVARASGGSRVRLAEANLGDGHAMTRHKAQGATVDIALVVGSSRSYPRSRLVAILRGRSANQLCVVRLRFVYAVTRAAVSGLL